MASPELNFIVDPLCGWTYAAGPLMAISQTLEPLTIRVHLGGMLVGDRRKPITPEWREFVKPHDARIQQISGQGFGKDYYAKLLSNEKLILDSEPSSIAISAIERAGGSAVDALNKIQQAYFYNGQNICDDSVIMELVRDMAIPEPTFKNALTSARQNIEAQFEQSRYLLNKVSGQGFPTAFLRLGSEIKKLDISSFYGQPHEWLNYLKSYLNDQ